MHVQNNQTFYLGPISPSGFNGSHWSFTGFPENLFSRNYFAFEADEPVDVEGEDRLFDESLLDHVVEDRGDPEDGDGGEAHAEDAVELGGQEGQTGLVSGLSEGLVLDTESGDLEPSS